MTKTKPSGHRQARGHRHRCRDTNTGTVTAFETEEARSTTRAKFTRSLISSVPDGPLPRRMGASQETRPISQSPHRKKESANEGDGGARREAMEKRHLRGKWDAEGRGSV